MATDSLNPFKNAQAQLDRAAEALGLDEATRLFLREPRREFTAAIPVRMDDGSARIFRGYRVQYNDARGPTKGGIRWHPDENIDTVRALAAWMTWKTSVMNLPLGGGKGGVTCNPRELSATEQERLARGYIRAFAGELGVRRDVPAPDVYTNPQVMSWMVDEYETHRGESHTGVITGKPAILGGSEGRGDATARGGTYAVREACARLNIDPAKATAAVQGFGNVGRYAALLIPEILGMRVVAISDVTCGLYNENGIDVKALEQYALRNGGVIEGFEQAESIDRDSLLELDVNVLFPAALENAITMENARGIRASVICELANGPTTPKADEVLRERQIFTIPDILANAGGVTVSYFEQVQNSYNYYWTLAEVQRNLDLRMTAAFNAVYELAQRRRTSMRDAAYLIAVERVADACKTRGWT
jgi:glutamate dehydrogenase (NAD(P)+)